MTLNTFRWHLGCVEAGLGIAFLPMSVLNKGNSDGIEITKVDNHFKQYH